ncbi:MAG: crotonase/enoyl-CoA hydratase family protein [Leptospiraceae bacterium]|nr:crotonase/enoyl-CoA hydratase family protein [Leptospiraceae bacterium]
MQFIKTHSEDHIFIISFNRAEESNSFNSQMLLEFSEALTQFEEGPNFRCAVVHANGKHFTIGLELNEVTEWMQKHGGIKYPSNNVDPFSMTGRKRTKPIVTAIHGFCFTLGIEFALTTEIRLCTKSTRFSQMEVARGIAPFGGATFRMIEQFGYGNAMKLLLTGEPFSSEEAYRVGLVQEIVDSKELLNRAKELANTIANNAPLGIQACLQNSRTYIEKGESEAALEIQNQALNLMNTKDAKEGVLSFVEKRKAKFNGN